MILVDYIIITIFIFFLLISFFRGLVREILSCMNICISYFLSIQNYEIFSLFFKNFTNIYLSKKIATLIFFFFIFLIGLIINYFIGILLKNLNLGLSDKILGSFFGFLRTIGFIFFSFLILKKIGMIEIKYFENSFFIFYIKKIITKLKIDLDFF